MTPADSFHTSTRVDPDLDAKAPIGKSTASGEVRWLDQIYHDPGRWATLTRRLRLLDLLHHPASVRPIETDLEASPPFLIFPFRQNFQGYLPLRRAISWGATLASLLVAAHRLGIYSGPLFADLLFMDDHGGVGLDLTATSPNVPQGIEDSDPAEDIVSLADLLSSVTKADPANRQPFADWRTLLEEMRSPRPEDRPLPEEVLKRLSCLDLSATIEVGDTPDNDTDHVGATLQKEISNYGEAVVGGYLGRFRLVESIGSGGVGQVFRAVDQADGRQVAIKVLHSRLAATDIARKRFLRESRLLAHLESPHITQLIEANHDGACCYLALEYIAGRDLSVYLEKNGRLDERAGLQLIGDAARGLAVAHARGIIHRDVKPGNLLVYEAPSATPGNIAESGNRTRVKVTDFGLARVIEQTESMEVTQAGAILGTPLYMAPEQFASKAPLDARADVYALGATLFHVLTGRPPFLADSFQQVMHKHVNEAPPALDRLVPEISAATAELVARTLSKDPSYRPADAGALVREIDRLLRGESAQSIEHPQLPQGSKGSRSYVYVWELNASPQRLWPMVSNTERLNRAAGLPAVQYTFRPDPQLGTRRFASARVGGLLMEWEEHAFEWVEGRRMGILREFSRGPFRWFVSIVELIPRPDGGTTLRQTCRVEPRGLFGRLAAFVELGIKTKRALGRVYRSIDAYLSLSDSNTVEADPFEEPTRLPAARQKRLRAALTRLVGRGASAQVTDLLGVYLSNASAQELARIRPRVLARRFGLDERETCDICLQAVIEGLLLLRWDVICPSCRIPSGRKQTLGELSDHESCPACNIRFQTDFTANVELVFEVHPDIGKAEVGRYCAGGPAHSPHVIAQMRVFGGEKVELPLPLTEGVYRLRGPQIPWAAEIRVAASALIRHADVDLGSAKEPRLLTMAPGGLSFTLNNTRSHELLVRVERSATQQDAWTAAQVQALPTFRVLFPGELRTPAHLTPPALVTLLLTQVMDNTAKEDIGEAETLNTLHTSFVLQEEVIRREGGTVVKTINEGVCAVFRESASALRAALALPAAIAANSDTHTLKLGFALHRGLARVVPINDRLDYYGAVVTLGHHLLDQAGPSELMLPTFLAADPEVEPLLKGYALAVTDIRREDGESSLAYRVTLPTEEATLPSPPVLGRERGRG